MEHKVEFFIWSEEMLLKNYESKIDQMIAGTYKFDTEHMTEKMIMSMTAKKAQNCIDALAYLRTLPEDQVILFDRGYNKEYAEYLAIVNR